MKKLDIKIFSAYQLMIPEMFSKEHEMKLFLEHLNFFKQFDGKDCKLLARSQPLSRKYFRITFDWLCYRLFDFMQAKIDTRVKQKAH